MNSYEVDSLHEYITQFLVLKVIFTNSTCDKVITTDNVATVHQTHQSTRKQPMTHQLNTTGMSSSSEN